MGKYKKTDRINRSHDAVQSISEGSIDKEELDSERGKDQNHGDEIRNQENEMMHIRDVNSRDIFKNNTLTSQFLRDYSGIDLLSDVQPEDIEDRTTWFRLKMGVEIEADTLKKVHVRIGDKQEEIYVLSLIEHKSEIDADVSMQLLRYMVSIWKDYAREYDEKNKNASRAASFRYPLIIPIVYYEGEKEWTVGIHLSERIAHAELARKYIPDYEYKIIPLHKYKDEDLKEHNNEMSLIMMINKIQNADDFHEFRMTTLEYMKSVFNNTTEEMQDLILTVIWGLLMKIKVRRDEAASMIKEVKEGKDMGILFENFKEFDYRAARKELKEEKARADEAEARADEAEARADEAEARAEKAKANLYEAKALIAELQRKLSSQQ